MKWAAADIHPTDLVLQSYGLGKLDDEAAEVISQHLDVCPDCVQRITGMSSDSFLGRLRRARLSDSGLASGISRAGATRIDGGASSSAPPPAATLPAELANNLDYEIIRELEGGGMGRVYLAHNRLMGRHEVIKLIDAEIIERPGVRERFLREIRRSPSSATPTSLPRTPLSAPARVWFLPWSTSKVSTWRGGLRPRGRCRCDTPATLCTRRRWACSTRTRPAWSTATLNPAT